LSPLDGDKTGEGLGGGKRWSASGGVQVVEWDEWWESLATLTQKRRGDEGEGDLRHA